MATKKCMWGINIHITQNLSFPSNFRICKCKSRFVLLSLQEMQDVSLSFKHCRLSSPQVCHVAYYYRLILSFCILSWIEVQQQQSRYHTSCWCSKTVSPELGVYIDINSCCYLLWKETNSSPPMAWANKSSRVNVSTTPCLVSCHKIPVNTNLQRRSS